MYIGLFSYIKHLEWTMLKKDNTPEEDNTKRCITYFTTKGVRQLDHTKPLSCFRNIFYDVVSVVHIIIFYSKSQFCFAIKRIGNRNEVLAYMTLYLALLFLTFTVNQHIFEDTLVLYKSPSNSLRDIHFYLI